MNRPLFQLVLMHFREFYREPAILFWSIIFPITMSWILGVAFTSEGDQYQKVALILNNSSKNINIRTFLNDAKPTFLKGTKIHAVTKSVNISNLGKTIYTFINTDENQAKIFLKRGIINLIIFERKDSIEYRFDPKNTTAQLIYLQLSGVIENNLQKSPSTVVKRLTQTGLRYIDFLIPGLIAFGIMNSCLWGICYTIIDWRKRKLLRRMVAAPMKKSDFILSIFLSRISLSFFENLLLFIFAHFYFNVPFEGQVVSFFAIFISGNIAFAGISILIASRTANSHVGNGLINAVSMPMLFLSGIFFSYHNFPDILTPVIKAFPLTMLADTIRSIFIEGARFSEIVFPCALLSGMGLIFGGIGLKIYKWH